MASLRADFAITLSPMVRTLFPDFRSLLPILETSGHVIARSNQQNTISKTLRFFSSSISAAVSGVAVCKRLYNDTVRPDMNSLTRRLAQLSGVNAVLSTVIASACCTNARAGYLAVGREVDLTSAPETAFTRLL